MTEAPPVEIPTPTPTAMEQQKGPQVNCSCPAGDKVKPFDFYQTWLTWLITIVQMTGYPVLNGFGHVSVYSFLTGRDWCTRCGRSHGWKGHLLLPLSTNCVWWQISLRAVCSTCLFVWTCLPFQGDAGPKGAIGPPGIKGEKGETVWNLQVCTFTHVQ